MENRSNAASQQQLVMLTSKSLFLIFPKCLMTKEEVHDLLCAKNTLIVGGVLARRPSTPNSKDCCPSDYSDYYVLLDLAFAWRTCFPPTHWHLAGCPGTHSSVVDRPQLLRDLLTLDHLTFTCSTSINKSRFTPRVDGSDSDDPLAVHPSLKPLLLLSLPLSGHSRPRATWVVASYSSGSAYSVHLNEPDLYTKDLSSLWDGYTGQKAVFVEDLDSAESLDHLLAWTTYPAQGETTLGHTTLTYDRLIVTSTYTIQQLFMNKDSALVSCLLGRFIYASLEPMALN